MNSDCLLTALVPLKESSRSAIADAECESFESVKEYLHIEREIETELENILLKVATSKRGTLVLVCGNVGDGKSHLISKLFQKRPDLRGQFEVFNDATESSSPTSTNIEELCKILEMYSDEALNTCSKHSILAINLGTLNNFLLAEKRNSFSELETFVTEMKILDLQPFKGETYQPDSAFQFVNLTDHSLFVLTETGPVSEIVECALKRVTALSNEANPFFKAYEKTCVECSSNCPVKINFELLGDSTIQRKVSDLLIQCIIKYHHIVSIRALYNFIYNLIVPVEIDGFGQDDVKGWLTKNNPDDYLKNIFLNYLFEHPEVSKIFKHLHFLDPALNRTAYLDDQIVSLITQENPATFFQNLEVPKALKSVLVSHAKSNNESDVLVHTYVRLVFFASLSPSEHRLEGITYNNYMALLYHWHSGNKLELKKLYRLVQKGTMSWQGTAPDGEMLLDVGNQQLKYRLSEKVSILPVDFPEEQIQVDNISKFSYVLPLTFGVHHSSVKLKIDIDYRLYEMLCSVSEGYKIKQSDKGQYIAFTSFVKDVMRTGELDKRLRVTEAATGKRFMLNFDEFGYFTFEVDA